MRIVVVTHEGAPVEHLTKALRPVAHLDALAAGELHEVEEVVGQFLEARVLRADSPRLERNRA